MWGIRLEKLNSEIGLARRRAPLGPAKENEVRLRTFRPMSNKPTNLNNELQRDTRDSGGGSHHGPKS